jgi:hypothetical protein
MPRTQREFLAAASKALDAIDERAKRLLDRLDAQAFNRTPPRGGWSPGQCLAHLTKAEAMYLKRMEASFTHARGTNGQRDWILTQPIRHNMFERWFIWILEPPARIKLPAPRVIHADGEWLDPVATSTAYFDMHNTIRDFLTRAHDIDIRRERMISPFASQLHLSIAAAIDIMMAHERRHLWQAERAAC